MAAAAAERPIIPALGLTERALKAYSPLIGYNSVLTEVCYCVTISEGKGQCLKRLKREYRYIECIYLWGEKEKVEYQSTLPFPVTGCSRFY